MAKKGSSSCIKIIIGGSSSSEDESNYSHGSTGTNYSESENHVEEETTDGGDVAPSYILQPTEISKNIDLMKTVAMLMENKLHQHHHKASDHDKMRDLSSDIERFPEAYQKFTNIVHQIQYLNVTTSWDCASEGNSNLGDSQGIKGFTKLFRPRKPDLPQDTRKRIMLQLLTDTQQVFNRYHKIQASLEDRLQKFTQLILKKSLRHPGKQTTDIPLNSDEDDPQQPLLSSNGTNYADFLQKADMLSETLRKTKRSGTEVQDSIEVLHDLISWDHRQVVSESSTGESIGHSGSYQQRQRIMEGDPTDVVICSRLDNQQTAASSWSNTNRKRIMLVIGTLAAAIILLITTAALSFLRFSY